MHFQFSLRLGKIWRSEVSTLKCLWLMPVNNVTASVNCWRRISIQHNSALLKGIEKKGLLEVAARTMQHMCNIMRHAVHQALIEHNPAVNLDGIIAAPFKRHYPALPLERLPELSSRIDGYH